MAAYAVAGTLLQINISGTFTNIGKVESFSGPTGSKPTIETTGISDTAATYVSGIPDYGELTINLFDDPADSGNARLLARFQASNVTDNFKIVAPFSGTGNTIAFDGTVNGWEMNFGKGEAAKLSAKVKLSGALTRS